MDDKWFSDKKEDVNIVSERVFEEHEVRDMISNQLMHHQLKMNTLNRIKDEMFYGRITPNQAVRKLDLMEQGVI